MRKVCKRIILEFIISIIIIFGIILLIPISFKLLWPFIIGWIIAAIANPLIKFFENTLKIKRKHGSIIIAICVLAAIITCIYGLLSGLFSLSKTFIEEMPQIYNNIESVLSSIENALNSKDFFGNYINANDIFDVINLKIKSIIEFITENSVTAASNFITNIPSIFMGTIFTILSAFFIIRDKDKIDENISEKINKIENNKFKILKESCTVTLKNYLKAQLKISGYIFILLFIGFLILGIDYSILVAFITSIVDFLPVFGAGTILCPWFVICFIMGDYVKGIGLLIIYILSLILRQGIQPKIISDCMDLNPIASLILMYVGFEIFGVTGLILSVPVGMIFYDLYKKGMFENIINDIKELYIAGKNHFEENNI